MNPECLYHYTSVDTLELILRNKTIRFNPLTKMDDPLEQWSAHGRQEGAHIFISSWTNESAEIPDMWKQYCRPGPENGVRLKLPVNPFSLKKNQLPNGMADSARMAIQLMDHFVHWSTGKHTTGDLFEDQKLFKEAIDAHPECRSKLSEMMNSFSHTTVECHHKDLNALLHEVVYTNKAKELFPRIYGNYQGMDFATYDGFGRIKDTSWSWQHEWRYMLHFFITTPGIKHADGSVDLYPLPFDYYDLVLDDEKLMQLEVTLSPVISKRCKKKAYELIERYCPTATVQESSLTKLS